MGHQRCHRIVLYDLLCVWVSPWLMDETHA